MRCFAVLVCPSISNGLVAPCTCPVSAGISTYSLQYLLQRTKAMSSVPSVHVHPARFAPAAEMRRVIPEVRTPTGATDRRCRAIRYGGCVSALWLLPECRTSLGVPAPRRHSSESNSCHCSDFFINSPWESASFLRAPVTPVVLAFHCASQPNRKTDWRAGDRWPAATVALWPIFKGRT